jgi:polar amino acid transport system permease protein
VQIFLLYFGLASLGVRMPTFAAAVLAMIINIAAYAAEIIRAGIDSVPRGQIEAAQCLGLSVWRIRWHVMLQPAIERVYPALTSQFLLMMQASAMASQISAEELTAIANTVQSDTFRSLETYLVVALLYLVLAVLVKLIAYAMGEPSSASSHPAPRRRPGPAQPASDPPGTAPLAHVPYVHAAVRLRARTGGRVIMMGGFSWTYFFSWCSPSAGPWCSRRFRAGRHRRIPGDAGAHLATGLAAATGIPLHRMRAGHSPLILLFIVYFGLSVYGLVLPALVAAGLAMMIYASAYLGDIWRGCVEAMPRPQWEASECLSLTRWQTLRLVIIPQATRLSLPPTIGFLVQLIKMTSLASVIGFVELTRAGQIINNSIFQPFLVFLLVGSFYFLLCYPLSRWSASMERKLNVGNR